MWKTMWEEKGMDRGMGKKKTYAESRQPRRDTQQTKRMRYDITRARAAAITLG